MAPRRYVEFMAYSQGLPPDQPTDRIEFSTFPEIYRMLRGRYFLSPNHTDLQQASIPDPLKRLELIYDYKVIEERDDILKALMDPEFDPRKTAILESEPEWRPDASGGNGTARIIDFSTDHLTIEADLPAPAILLITDAYAKGWRARPVSSSQQETYDLMPANYVLRAIPLRAGAHRIRVEYAPAAYAIGRVVSIISLCLYLVLTGWAIRRRRIK
jgi:hypothetical protein